MRFKIKIADQPEDIEAKAREIQALVPGGIVHMVNQARSYIALTVDISKEELDAALQGLPFHEKMKIDEDLQGQAG